MVFTWCSVPLCKNLASPYKDHQFYPFPTDPNLRLRWIQITKYSKEIVGREAVCCLHFTKDNFEYCKQTNSYVLKSSALPNQYLPKTGESDSFPFTPNKGRITKQDAGLHFSELLRKLRESVPATVSKPKSTYLSNKDLEVRKKLKEDPYIREYVMKEAFPNLNYEALSLLLKKVTDPNGKVTINHSSAKHVISLTYQTAGDLEASDELNARNMVHLARDEPQASRMRPRELADELDFTGQISFTEKFPNIYRDNYFDIWPTQRRKRGKVEVVPDSDEQAERSKSKPYVYKVCYKCCKLVPNEVIPVHLQMCDFRMSQCTTCFAGFLSPTELHDHIKASHPDALNETATTGPYQCGKCDNTYFKLPMLEKHISEHQKIIQGSKFECGLCTSVFADMTDLTTHFINEHEIRQDVAMVAPNDARTATKEVTPLVYKCGFCGEHFGHSQAVADHLKEKHGNDMIQSDQPNVGMLTKPTVVKNPSKLTEADMGGPEGTFDIFLCKHCPARYRTLKDFKTHSELFTGHRLLKNCTFCENEFTDEAAYNNHINTHNPEKLFRCNKCIGSASNFEDLEQLVEHRRKVHPTEISWLFRCCKVCKKAVFGPTMGQHRAFHRLNTQFQCPECNTFMPLSERKFHVQQHQNEQNTLRKCRFCHVFEVKELLSEHEAIYHPEESPYICVLCGTKCDTQEQLKRHADLSHSPVEFRSLGSSLYKTIVVENAEYYECRICLVDHVYRAEMVKHIRSDHLRRPRQNTCTICGRIFRRARTLLTHLKKLECQPGQNLPLVKKPCWVCKKWLPKQDHLEHFKREHVGQFPVECVLCGQVFKEQYQLVQHIDVNHTSDERRTFITRQRGYQVYVDGKYQYYECKLCCQEFTHKVTCEEHLQSHTFDTYLNDSDIIMEIDVVEELNDENKDDGDQ
ncbi:zinc finger protein 84-like [Armigeres subalbatus]|uniref:zinc finger protein 84-like n=1 Tax=Armigeres subalbatus TaxID=124917 RepID=UPI002ED448A0